MKKLILLTALIALVALTVSFARAGEELRLPENVHLISWNGETIEGTVYKESKETYSVIWGKVPFLNVREDLDKYYEWITITCRVSTTYGEPVYEDYTRTWVLSSADLRENPALTWWDIIPDKMIPFPEGTLLIREMYCIAGVRGDVSVDNIEESVTKFKSQW